MSGVAVDSRYKPIRILGSGSFGEIRVARDRTLARDVAMKVVHSQFSDNQQVLDRFMQEVETLSHLEHPNIVPIYDSGRLTDGRPFFAMRLIDGNTLEHLTTDLHQENKRCRDASRYESDRFRELLVCLLDAARGIAYAHKRGVVHRDIKPGNILIGKDGDTVVIDWGTAKWLEKKSLQPSDFGQTLVAGQSRPETVDRPLDTIQGMILGTPAFMSPEQAVGNIEKVDRTSDIYSLGATLYFVLTGLPPHKGEEIGEVLGRAQISQVTGVHNVAAACPPRLAEICERAMAKESANRYSSVDEMLLDLQAYLDTRLIASLNEESPEEPNSHLPSKVWWPLTTAAISIAAVLVIGLVCLVYSRTLNDSKRRIAELNGELASRPEFSTTTDAEKQPETANDTDAGIAQERSVPESVHEILSEQHAVLQETVDEQELRISELTGHIEQVKESLATAESAREGTQVRVDELEKDLADSRQELQLARESQRGGSSDARTYLDKISRLENELSEARAEDQERDQAFRQTTSRLETLESDLRLAQRTTTEAETSIRQLQEQLSGERQTVAQLERRLDNTDSDNRLVSHYTREEIVKILTGAQFNAQLLDNDEIELKSDGNRYRVVVYPTGDIMLFFGLQGGDWTHERINDWNREQRFTRAYLIDRDKAVLESDLFVSEGYTPEALVSFTESFISSAKKYMVFLNDSPRSRLRSFFGPSSDSVPPPPAPIDF